MLNEIEFDRRIENIFINEKDYRDIVIEYFNSYCLQVFNKIYDYNVFNIKVFLFDLFRIEFESGIFLFKTKEEVSITNNNYRYVSMLNITRLTNIEDFKDYVEQQLNE